MALRVLRKGTTEIKDHNELINRGVRTHAEIDTYLDELDEARGQRTSIDERFSEIEDGMSDQESRLDDLGTAVGEAVQEITQARGDKPSLAERLREIEQRQVDSQEVIDARTDMNGNVFANLKARLDAMQAQIGQGGGGGGVITPVNGSLVYRIEFQKGTRSTPQQVFSVPEYTLGDGSLFVFVEGILVVKGETYEETDSTTITFYEPVPTDVTVTVLCLGKYDPTLEETVLEMKETVDALEQEIVEARREYVSLDERITSSGGGGGSGEFVVRQITRLNVEASENSPKVIDIKVPTTLDFRVPPVSVLKLIPGQQIITTHTEFDNSDSTDFIEVPGVVFDGRMHLQTKFTESMVLEEGVESGSLFSLKLRKSDFKRIEGVEL